MHQFLDNHRKINNIESLSLIENSAVLRLKRKRKPNMPIYEFRCLKCNDCFEFLLRNQEEQLELRCPKCKSEEFERVMSVSCHSVGDASPKAESAQSQTRSCPSGTCTTYDIPGHSQ